MPKTVQEGGFLVYNRTMEKEVWKDIKDYEGFYQVSSLGRVKRLAYRRKDSLGRKQFYCEKVLKGSYDKDGYLSVSIRGKTCRIHRLVCEAFHPNPEHKPQVNHLNNHRDDNRASNLEWVTNSENQLYAYREMGREHCSHHRKEVVCIETGERYPCARIAAETINVRRVSIQNAIAGRAQTCAGFHWRYAGNDEYIPDRWNKSISIRCVETGEQYPSIIEAGRRTGISRKMIHRVLKKSSKTAGGFHWEYVDNPSK